jgi:hypothetical protein
MPDIDWERAILRGRCMCAVAKMEWTGVPLDRELLDRLRRCWSRIKELLVAEVDRDFGVYVGTSFNTARFEAFLTSKDIPWPRLASGGIKLDDDTFKEMAQRYPVLEPLRQLRRTLSQLRLNDIAVGVDGRNRVLLSPFSTMTGRNAPSNSRFIFGPARFVRGLIKPPSGYGICLHRLEKPRDCDCRCALRRSADD